MSCDMYRENVDRWIDNQLTNRERKDIESHLDACADCRQLYAQRKSEDEQLRAAFSHARQSAAAVADQVVGEVSTKTRVAARRPGRWSLLMAAAAGFLLALILFPPWKPTAPNHVDRQPAAVAQVTLVAGSLERTQHADSAEAWTPVAKSDLIEEQSRIRTGVSDLCELRSDAGDVIRLNCDTEVVIGHMKQLELNRGQIWCESGVVDESLRITTPDHELHVDGACDVTRNDQQLDIVVCAGTTTVQSKQGPQKLHAGEQARVVDGELEQSPSHVDPLLATRWIHPLLAQRSADDQEVTDRIEQLWSAVGRAKLGLLYEEELRVLGDRCSQPLMAYLNSPQSRHEAEKREKAAKILADVADHRWATKFVDLLEDENEGVRLHAARGLERLTGQTFGVVSADWKNPQQCVNALKSWQDWKQNHRKRIPNQPVVSPTKRSNFKKG